jgi:hypothetical protein
VTTATPPSRNDDHDLAPGGQTVTDSASPPTSAGRERPQTGHPQVDQATGALDDLDDLPVDEHAGVYDQVDSELRSVLATATDSVPEDAAAAIDSPPGADPGA